MGEKASSYFGQHDVGDDKGSSPRLRALRRYAAHLRWPIFRGFRELLMCENRNSCIGCEDMGNDME